MRIAATIMCLSVFGSVALASAPPKVVVGAIANNSLRQGLISKSLSTLDIAIAGNGFIPLKSKDGSILFTRQGSLGMDGDGDLSHRPSGLKVVVQNETGKFSTTHLASFSTQRPANAAGSKEKLLPTLVNMSFTENGVLQGYYSDGRVVDIVKLKLAAFENTNKLKVQNESAYILEATSGVGETVYLPALTHPMGAIYGGHLESVSMTEYIKALR